MKADFLKVTPVGVNSLQNGSPSASGHHNLALTLFSGTAGLGWPWYSLHFTASGQIMSASCAIPVILSISARYVGNK